MAELEDAAYLNDGCVTAQGDRQVLASIVCTEGVVPNHGDALEVIADTPASMDVIVGSGNAFIEGTQVAWQGMYGVSNDADKTLTIGTADPTDDRIDLVVARVYDPTYGDPDQPWALEVVAGTPSPAPAPPALPDNSLLLATITVGAGVTTITSGDITDERTDYVLCAVGDGGTLIDTIVYGATDTFDKADYPTASFVDVEVVGSGGAGGGAAAAAESTGGGGGAGAYCRATLDITALSASETVTVGAAAAGGGGAADGGDGATSSFGTHIVCTGGTGGNHQVGPGNYAGMDSPDGAGGTVTTSPVGAVVVNGQDGGHPWWNGDLGYAGEGASTPLGLGGAGRAMANFVGQTAAGNAGTGYGSGGGGAINSGGGNNTGGNSPTGVVIVRVYG